MELFLFPVFGVILVTEKGSFLLHLTHAPRAPSRGLFRGVPHPFFLLCLAYSWRDFGMVLVATGGGYHQQKTQARSATRGVFLIASMSWWSVAPPSENVFDSI
ncbi:MAG TPA: hypothetical protein VFV08_15080, partial [Puia sp.]|nr:hypothetical protein [Puia sp.]